jgi:hydrogenase nickel incorporation protein HypB
MNSHVTILPVSAKTGEGLEEWYTWVRYAIAGG